MNLVMHIEPCHIFRGALNIESLYSAQSLFICDVSVHSLYQNYEVCKRLHIWAWLFKTNDVVS